MQQTPQNIILIGFMGSGKSTVGRTLARQLGEAWRYVDTDKRLVQVAGKEISQIFATEGEGAFREKEARVLLGVTAGERQVIATGGGVVLREENVSAMRGAGVVIWLTAEVEEVEARIGKHPEKRPLLAQAGEDRKAYLLKLLGERGTLYRQAAHLTVDTSRRAPEAIAREIRRKVGLA
jgi:shikimate kinase